jgi:hypothetical protein
LLGLERIMGTKRASSVRLVLLREQKDVSGKPQWNRQRKDWEN